MTNEWDAAAPVYEDQFEQVTGTTVPRLVEWLEPRAGLTFADVACGPGTVAMALAERGAAVWVSDFSAEMVKRALARAAERGFSAVSGDVADAASLPLPDGTVDGAVSNFGVIFCPDIAGALHELGRVTRPGGHLAITAWTTEAANGWTTLLADDYADELGFSVPPRPMYRWGSARELRKALDDAGWHSIDIVTVDFEPTRHAPDDVGDALTTPATRLALASLNDAQVDALRAYLVRRGRELFGGEPVPLPRQAWLARGTA
ncbi:MAG TPA: methyltransferase domain-containing protein [Acidimicrobiales bacterium]|nr:methyltransferase domain-containing protein [Acidimicrobiales bacterium]